MSNPTTLDVAKHLASVGYSVFPAEITRLPNGKKDVRPCVKWTMASTTLPGMIDEWWKQWPEAFACIDTGKSGTVVVDCDVKGPNGVDNWHALAEGELTTHVLATTSGGEHHLYRADPEHPVRNDQDGAIAEGVDLRADGGMVIVHPAGYSAALALPAPAGLDMVPAVVPRLMGAKRTQEAPSAPRSDRGDRTFTREQAIEFVRSQARLPLESAPLGTINGRLNDAACVLSHFVPEFWDAEAATEHLLRWQQAAWVAGGGADDGDYIAARKTIASGLNQTRDPWRAQLVEVTLDAPAPAPGQDDEERAYRRLKADRAARVRIAEEDRAALASDEAVAALRAELLTSGDLDSIEPLTPLVDGWLYQDSVARIMGKSGSFKTFVALDMACAVATERPWFGYKTNGSPVVYVVAEGVRGIKKRVRAWELEHNCGVQIDNLFILPRPVQMMDDEFLALECVCKALGAKMVILDTQARVTVGVNEDNNSEMGEVVARAERMRENTGACVILVHHTGHDKDRARGASCVYAALQSEIEIKRTDKTTKLKISATKQKDGPEESGQFKMVESGDSLVLANLDGEDKEEGEDQRVKKAVSTIVAVGAGLSGQLATVIHSLTDTTEDGATPSEIVKVLNQSLVAAKALPYASKARKGISRDNGSISTELNRMVGRGELAKPSSGKYRMTEAGCSKHGLHYTEALTRDED
ncbi:MAG: AAA family ATPase [Dermatophilaceae bacterium]